jgi:hypothetical protein
MPHIFIMGGSRLTIPPAAIVLRKPFGMAGLIEALNRVAWQFATS